MIATIDFLALMNQFSFKMIWLLVTVLAFSPMAWAKSRKAAHRSDAHKQFDYFDANEDSAWVGQFTLETDRYQAVDFFYTSLTLSRHNWTLELGEQNLALNGGNSTDSLVYVGISKQFDLTPWFSVSVSSHNGRYSQHFAYTNMDYVTFSLNDGGNGIAIGPYYANAWLSETSNVVGYIALWNVGYQRFNLNGSYLSGTSNISGLSVNLAFELDRHLQPYLGFGDTAPNLQCQPCSQYYYLALGMNINF